MSHCDPPFPTLFQSRFTSVAPPLILLLLNCKCDTEVHKGFLNYNYEIFPLMYTQGKCYMTYFQH